MLWIYDQYRYLDSFSAEIVFIRHTYKDGPHAVGVKPLSETKFVFNIFLLVNEITDLQNFGLKFILRVKD